MSLLQVIWMEIVHSKQYAKAAPVVKPLVKLQCLKYGQQCEIWGNLD